MAVIVLEQGCRKCGGMICINVLKLKQSASETTYANNPSEEYKKGLCFECATGINLDKLSKTKLEKKKCK